MLPEEQRTKLHHLIKRLTEAQADVADAFDTTFMSDAKSAVYGLRTDVEADQTIDPGIKARLMPYLEAAWSAISDSESTYSRAGKSLEQLGRAEAYLKDQLGG